MTDERLTIGGRVFQRATVTTLDQDAYVMQRMRAFGLAEMASAFDPKTGHMEDFGEKVLLAAFESGQLYEILGGTLVEEGVKWSRAVATANASFFASVTGRNDKQTIYGTTSAILLDFLLVAATLSPTFLRSSMSGGQTEPAPYDRIEAPSASTMESGTGLSEISPATT